MTDRAPGTLVLWDIDGTLLDPAGFGWRLAKAAFLDLFGSPLTAEVPRAGRTDRAIYVEALTRHAIAPERVDDLIAAVSALATDPHEWTGHVLPGAVEAVTALGAREPSALQSVLTGNLRAVAVTKLAAIQLSDALDLTVGAFGDDHLVRADLVDIALAHVARRHGVDPATVHTVLIGDTPLDVEAALARDARAVAVATGGYTEAQLLAAGAHAILPDLTDPERLRAAVFGP